MSFRKGQTKEDIIKERTSRISNERRERRREFQSQRRQQEIDRQDAEATAESLRQEQQRQETLRQEQQRLEEARQEQRCQQLAGVLNREIDDVHHIINHVVDDHARPREPVPEGTPPDTIHNYRERLEQGSLEDGWKEIETQPIQDQSRALLNQIPELWEQTQEIQQAQIVDESHYIPVNPQQEEIREISPQEAQDNHRELDNSLNDWVRENYEELFEERNEERVEEIHNNIPDNTKEREVIVIDDDSVVPAIIEINDSVETIETPLSNEYVREILREVDEEKPREITQRMNEEPPRETLLNQVNDEERAIPQRMIEEPSRETLLTQVEDRARNWFSNENHQPDDQIRQMILPTQQAQIQQAQIEEELQRMVPTNPLEIALQRLEQYIRNNVDIWKNRDEEEMVKLHRLENFQTILKIVKARDRRWEEATLDERRQLLLQLSQIPGHILLNNITITVVLRATGRCLFHYPLSALTDDALYDTREKFEENYESRTNEGLNIIQPLEEILEVQLVLNHRLLNNTPRLDLLQGNFFPFYIDPLVAEDEMIEELKMFEIFIEKDWKPKENCFFMALVHWNEYWNQEAHKNPNKIIPQETLTKIKFRLRGNGLTKILLEKIGLDFDIHFVVKHEKFTKRKNEIELNSYTEDFNKGARLKVDLCLLIYLEQGHFFIDVPTKFTVTGVNYYFEMRAYKENRQFGLNAREIPARTFEERVSITGYERGNQPTWSGNKNFIDSSLLIRLMLKSTLKNKKHRFFVEIPNYMLYRGYFHGVNTKYVENVDVDPKLDPDIKVITWEERKNNDIFYVADTECCTQDRHKPYAISYCPLGKEDKIITCIGVNCIGEFCDRMNSICKRNVHFIRKEKNNQSFNKQDKKVIVYFHNLSYDGRMFADQNIISIKMNQNRIIEMVILMKCGIWLHLRDSYMLIPSKLANFPGMFGTAEKEKKVFPYSFIKIEMFEEKECWVPYVDIVNAYYRKGLWTIDELNDFANVCHDDIVDGEYILNRETNEINIHLLVKNYVESDVKILSQGLTWFRNNIKEALGLDVTNYLSISALAYDYFKKEVYAGENIYEYTGQVRDFIRQAVYGGRCMTRGNNAYKLNNVRLLDIDACSLYPSAMSIMDIPKGVPKKMPQMNRQELERRLNQSGPNHYDAVIVRIRIKAIGRALQFPLICERNNKGVVMYENFINAELVIDDIQLKEMIKWQQIDYEIIEGIYWNEGVSTKINEKIKEIYEKRKEAKSQTPPNKIEQIYKMLMNSSYGKCIEMAKPQKCHVIEGQNYLNRLFRNYTNIQRIDEIISFDNESRREEIERKMLYKALEKEDEQWLTELEKNTKFIFREYNQYDNFFVPTMIGVRVLSYSKKLMNEVMVPAELEGILIFYQDTDSMHVLECQEKQLEDAWRKHNGKSEDQKLYGSDMCQFHSDFERVDGKEAVSHSSIFLGKKMYLDVLISRYDETDKIKMMTRMKGISRESLEMFTFDDNQNIEINEKIWRIYNDLFNGQSLQFELVINKSRFEFTRNLEVKSINSFKRTVNAPECIRWEFDEEGNWNKK